MGQDCHQSGAENKNILEQWGQLFTPDAQIDVTDLGVPKVMSQEYAELTQGPGLTGGGLEVPFKAWQHIEGHGTVTITGDTATSVALHLHSHITKDGKVICMMPVIGMDKRRVLPRI
ncbi:nuclear transport factor 2 family protein [Pseudomonas tolaasii]|nr:nuclear transport factor 2 family protein [Pseudomonas tolaasii]